MKRIWMIAFALLAFACTQTEPQYPGENPVSGTETRSFSATHEQSDEGSRTELQGDDSVLWIDGDQIQLVWNGGSAASEALASLPGGKAATADFSVDLPAETDPDFGVYPAAIAAAYDGSDFLVTVPDEQDGSFASAAIEVAQVSGGTLSFKNLGALLELSTGASVDEIVITAYGGKDIAGTVPVSFNDGLPVAGEVVSGASSSITLSGLSGTGPFYAAILPGSWDEGLYIELRSSGAVVGQKFTGKTLSAVRKGLVPLGSIAAVPVSGTFVRPEATGSSSGADWDNAMSGDNFLSGVAAGTISGNVFLAEGPYAQTVEAGRTIKAGSSFKVYGGYSAASTGTDLSKRNITLYPTVITGGVKSRLFVWSSSTIVTTFDGVSFCDAYRDNSDQGSALILHRCNSATFNNCIISGCKKLGGAGGAVRVNSGTMTFTNCTFSGNSADSNGGVISHSSGDSTPNLSFTDCRFQNNYTVTGGAVFHAVANVQTTFTRCVFSGNGVSPDDASVHTVQGGVVNMTTGTVVFTDCTFENNIAGDGGVVYASSGAIQSSGCTYTGNTASPATPSNNSGGGCYRLTGAVTLDLSHDVFLANNAYETLNDSGQPSTAKNAGAVIMAYAGSNPAWVIRADKCLFSGNLSGSRGTVRNQSSNGKLYLNACSFYGNKVNAYGSAIHNIGTCAVVNCAFQLNENTTSSGASNYYTGGGKSLIANSCIRMYGNSAVGVYGAGGNCWLVNNTLINSAHSTNAVNAVALKSKVSVVSLGHNIVSKFYEEGAGSYTSSATDVMDYQLYQDWIDSPYFLIKWTSWKAGTWVSGKWEYSIQDPGFTKATPAEVVDAIDAFETAAGVDDLKSWLQSLSYDGGNALQTDIRGIARSTTAIWPGSYDNSANDPDHPLP